MRRPLAVAVAGVVLAAACTGQAPVAESVRDAFVDCMQERGFAVEEVEVSLQGGNHIESFSWEPTGQDDVGAIGQECEDEVLERLEVSRT